MQTDMNDKKESFIKRWGDSISNREKNQCKGPVAE